MEITVDDLNEGQLNAYHLTIEKMLIPGSIAAMTGAAGTGKTSILGLIVDALMAHNRVRLGCPTGMAAKVASKKTGRIVRTMHRMLYAGVDEDEEGNLEFFAPSPPCGPGEFVIVDESSMIHPRLFEEFQQWVPEGSSVLYIGDREQLPPVMSQRDQREWGRTWGPPLEDPTANLTQVHRQALDSSILSYATAIREGRKEQWEAGYDMDDPSLQVWDGLESAKDWLVHQREGGNDATLLCFDHKTRQRLNAEVRAALGLAGEPIVEGDKLVVKMNSRRTGLMNGEVVTVKNVVDYWTEEFEGETQKMVKLMLEEYPLEVMVNLNYLDQKNATGFNRWQRRLKRFRALHVHYGQCLTVHSAQGSQWDKVGFVNSSIYRWRAREDAEFGRRLLYTAVTRAAEELAIFMA